MKLNKLQLTLEVVIFLNDVNTYGTLEKKSSSIFYQRLEKTFVSLLLVPNRFFDVVFN